MFGYEILADSSLITKVLLTLCVPFTILAITSLLRRHDERLLV